MDSLISCNYPVPLKRGTFRPCQIKVKSGTPRCAAGHTVQQAGQGLLFDPAVYTIPDASLVSDPQKITNREPGQDLDEWVKEAGLAYEVDKRPVWSQNDHGDMIQMPDRYCVFRKDTQSPLGDVGRVWTAVQPAEVVRFAADLEEQVDAHISQGGYLRGGAHCWISLRMPAGDASILGDPITATARITNDYDGTASLAIYVTPIHERSGLQIGCSVDDLAYSTFIRHTNSIDERLQEAKARGENASRTLQAFAKRAAEMAEAPYSDGRTRDLVKKAFAIDDDEKAVKMGEEINYIREHTSEIPDKLRNTNWGAYLSVVIYYNRRWANRGAEQTQLSSLRGAQARVRQTAFTVLRPAPKK